MLPTFSIVIPSYNRPQRLTDCLTALTRLDYPRDRFEVIVVDDGSQPPLQSVVEPFYHPLNLKLIAQANAGPAIARNQGALAAQGDFLAFTDDDCQPASDWLLTLAQQFTKTPHAFLGGYVLNALPKNPFSAASQLLIDYIYGYYNTDPNRATFFASNNIALPRKTFHQIGQFDTTFPLPAGEDRELSDRWVFHGYPMLYVADAKVYHAHDLSLKTFWKQHFYYGRGAYHYHRIRAARASNQIKVEPLTFYWNLVTFPFSRPTQQPAILLSGLLLLTQIANVLGFFREKLFPHASRKTHAIRGKT